MAENEKIILEKAGRVYVVSEECTVGTVGALPVMSAYSESLDKHLILYIHKGCEIPKIRGIAHSNEEADKRLYKYALKVAAEFSRNTGKPLADLTQIPKHTGLVKKVSC